jgi:hypothetical protein
MQLEFIQCFLELVIQVVYNFNSFTVIDLPFFPLVSIC